MTLDNILEEINKAESIVILTHENPDGDAIGSSLALYNALKDYYTGQFTNQFFSVGERLGALRSQLGYEVPEKGLDRALRKYRELQDLETEPVIADIQRERVETIKKNKKQEKELNKGFMSSRLDPEMDVRGGETWRK